MKATVAALAMSALVFFGVWHLFLRDSGKPAVLLIGLDGADWDILDPLIEQGKLPNLARLRREGVSGPLMTLRDIALSPVIWTSVATGKGPAQHGITWFLVDTPDGKRVPVRSYNRKVKAIWNILAENDRRAGFVGWWASAPAEDVGDGVMVSDALGYHGFGRTGQGMPDSDKVHPGELFDEFAAMMPPIQQIDYRYGQRFFNMTADEYYREAFEPGRDVKPDPNNPVHLFQEYASTSLGYTSITNSLLESQDLDLLGVYLEATDSMSHLFMKYAPPRQDWVDEKEYQRFKDAVDGYYVFIDEQLGEILSRVPEDWAVFVVSDHGFRIGDSRPKSVQTVDMRGAHLDHEPEGIFIARGPGIRTNTVLEKGSVLDVTPTLLHYLGLPVAKDMDGRVLTDVFSAERLEQQPIQYVSTFESPGGSKPPPTVLAAEGDFEADEALQRLQALGYVGEDLASTGDQNPGELSSPEQHNNLGRIHLGKGELDQALVEFNRALEVSPGNGEAHVNIGLVHRIRGNSDAAIRSFNQALQSNANNIGALIQIAEIRAERGELAAAENLYRQVLAIDDRLPGPYLGLGDAVLRQGRPAEAKDLFLLAIELDPRLADAHYNLGVAHGALEQHDEARKAYEKTLELVPEHAMALNNLGNFLLNAGDTEQALDHFKRAAKAAPGHMESRYNVGSILLLLGNAEEAIPWLEEAAQLGPEEYAPQHRLAKAFLVAGMTPKATRHYEMLARVFPGSAEALYHLAVIAHRAGNEEQTTAYLRSAVQRGGEAVKRELQKDPEFQDLDLQNVLGGTH